MDKAFVHDEKCGCEYCNSGKKIQFALVKIKDKFNFISVNEVEALDSDKLTYKTEDMDDVLNAEKENKFSVFYGGIIYYSPENSIQDEIIKEVKNSKDHTFLYYDELECKYLGLMDIKLFPEEMKETKNTLKLIPCIAKVILPKSAEKVLKKQKYLTSSLNRLYKNRETDEETGYVSADNIIYYREFGLVITSEEVKKLIGLDFSEEEIKELEFYEADRLKDIYNLLEL